MGALAAASGGGAGNTVIAFIATIAGILLYWLPSLVGWRRHVPGLGQVVIWNFFAFFFLVPWIVALVLAFREPKPLPPRPVSRSAGG